MIRNIKFFNKNLVLILNKPIFLTSNYFIQLIKKYSLFEKIGHAGTLDPSASGVLIVCTNSKTAFLNVLIEQRKRYLVFSIVGIDSVSLDFFGKIKYFDFRKINVETYIIKSFLYSIRTNTFQKSPIYSSVKHNGYSFYKYSRLDQSVRAKNHTVKIYKFFLIKKIENVLIFDIECSKGTYVREIVNSLSCKFKLPIVVYRIIRLKISNYSILNSFNLF
ncbi:MAG TPA: pseudouridine synthase family protein [Candidatus Azoamicus sp.]